MNIETNGRGLLQTPVLMPLLPGTQIGDLDRQLESSNGSIEYFHLFTFLMVYIRVQKKRHRKRTAT